MTIPSSLRERPQWLVWKFEKDPKRPNAGKLLKVPYYADGGRRVGDQGDEKDRRRLVTHAEAAKVAPKKGSDVGCGGVGFAFLPGDGLIGIDLDGAIELVTDQTTGEITRRALERTAEIIKACDSYTEYSPSSKGVHIICAGDTSALFDDKVARSFKSNKIGVEVFCGGQYFTFTGDVYPGTPLEARPIAEKVLRRLYKTVRPPKAKSPPSAAAAAPAPAEDDHRRADAALAYVDADDYQQWIDIGHVLKFTFGEAGFSTWDRWSMKSAKYDGVVAREKWATFNPDGRLTLGTIFELARRGGWSPPRSPRRLQGAGNPGRPPKEPESEPSADHPNAPGAGDPGEPPANGGDEGGGDEVERPEIYWTAGELPRCVDEAEEALIKAGMRIYQRAGFLVRVIRRDTPSVRHYLRRPPGGLGIVTVDVHYLIEAFTKAARWVKWNARAKPEGWGDGDPVGAWVPMNAPEHAATTFIARRGHWNLPLLSSAISAPTLRPDGTVLQEPGYDRAMQCWYDPCGVEFPRIPDKPTHADAVKALGVLDGAFKSFPFEGKVDKSVALALALTALVRRSLPEAPLGGITAPMMASGKTLLANCIAILATGVSAPAMKYAETDDEFTKTMLAVLAEGDQVVMIDNVDRPLHNDTLCVVLTSESYRQRVLGRTEMMTVPTTTLFLATGNHLVIAGDTRTRALLCRLDPETEHPEQRQFPGMELRTWMTQHRPELVAAGLTIMRAFIASGQQPIDHCATWGRFERWSDMVRAPLIWLGCEDPCASLKGLEKEDPERIELIRMIMVLEAACADQAYTAAEIIEMAKTNAALEAVLKDVCKLRDGTLDSRRFSHWLRKHSDRIITPEPPDNVLKAGTENPDSAAARKLEQVRQPRRLVRDGEKDHTTLWKVEVMKTK